MNMIDRKRIHMRCLSPLYTNAKLQPDFTDSVAK